MITLKDKVKDYQGLRSKHFQYEDVRNAINEDILDDKMFCAGIIQRIKSYNVNELLLFDIKEMIKIHQKNKLRNFGNFQDDTTMKDE